MHRNFFYFFVHKKSAKTNYVCEGEDGPFLKTQRKKMNKTVRKMVFAVVSGGIGLAASAAVIKKPGVVLFVR